MRTEIVRFDNLDIVMVAGLPGSGKSHFARTYFKADHRKRINRAEIRKHLFEMTTFGDEWLESKFNEKDEALVKHIEHKLFEHLLTERQKVLIDNTSLTEASRKFYIEHAAHLHKTIGIVFLETPVQKCLARNHTRPDFVPDNIVVNMYAGMEKPSEGEGFKEILLVADY